jgi:gas vesicle protein
MGHFVVGLFIGGVIGFLLGLISMAKYVVKKYGKKREVEG